MNPTAIAAGKLVEIEIERARKRQVEQGFSHVNPLGSVEPKGGGVLDASAISWGTNWVLAMPRLIEPCELREKALLKWCRP